MKFESLHEGKYPPGLIASVDPGETTGLALFLDGSLIKCDQLGTGEAVTGATKIWSWIESHGNISFLVVEEYRVYAWKTRQHSWSNLHTARLIGGLDVYAHTHKKNVAKQSAQSAKGFCTDEKLREWGYYTTKKHARDAIRHGCYFILFGNWQPTSDRSNPPPQRS